MKKTTTRQSSLKKKEPLSGNRGSIAISSSEYHSKEIQATTSPTERVQLHYILHEYREGTFIDPELMIEKASRVPSLSIGTLKSTPTITNPLTTNFKLVKSMAKIYPERVDIIEFIKHSLRINMVKETKLPTPPRSPVVEISNIGTKLSPLEVIEHSIARTRRSMLELAECNYFDMFATFTFDPKKHPQCYDMAWAEKKIIYWLNNQQTAHGNFNYLLVRERMKDGKVHFHALLGAFTGIFHEVPLSKKQILRKIDGLKAYKIDSWEKINGFADMELIVDKQKLTNYIMKYITKDISLLESGKKRYFANKSLVRPHVIYNPPTSLISGSRGRVAYDESRAKTYETEWVRVTQIPISPYKDKNKLPPNS